MKKRHAISIVLNCLVIFAPVITAKGQSERCDPTKVMTTETCVRCHGSEVAQWQKTPHFQTFETLVRNPHATEITARLGLPSVKRNDLCIRCHYTVQFDGLKNKPIAGVSCESCHGASKDWIKVHNDYGGPLTTRQSEAPEHRISRLKKSSELGMRNTTNLYAVARSCLECHTVPDERLVDVGGHVAGSEMFELVAWSQGVVRHNFARTGGAVNAESTVEQLRVMYVCGLIADLEFSTRAVAEASTRGPYGMTSAQRAATVAIKLFDVQQQANDPNIERALVAFAQAELKTQNRDQLTAIANEIQHAGVDFAGTADGRQFAFLDARLPKPDEYK